MIYTCPCGGQEWIVHGGEDEQVECVMCRKKYTITVTEDESEVSMMRLARARVMTAKEFNERYK
jgi:hypothetical protein